MAKRKPWYGVANGRTIGVFSSWSSLSIPHSPSVPLPLLSGLTVFRDDCKASVEGFADNKYKGFNSQADATSYVAGYTLANKKQKESAQKAVVDKAKSTIKSTGNTSHTTDSRSYARMGSYAELTEDDFEDRRIQEAAFWGDPKPLRRTRDELSSSPPPAARKKRPSPDTLSSTSKRSKLNDYDIEVIDLTDSPPKRPTESTYDSWESSYSSYSNKPRAKNREDSYSQLLTDLFTTTTTSRKPPPIPKFTLQDCSPEQRNILELVSKGKNVFFTGSAGVGKSFVLEKICQLFQSQGRKQFIDFFVTASTGTRLPPLYKGC
jgi:hypothetical protein